MYHIYLGIDPGKKGAVAYVTVEGGKTGIIDMPLLENGSPSSEELKNFILSSIKGFDLTKALVIIEKQQSMHKQGVVSTFTTAYGYGKLIATLEMMGIPFIEIRPAKWKKKLNLSKDKQQSVDLAHQLYPHETYFGPRGGLLDGRAEAILMAYYGMSEIKKRDI